MGIIKQILDYTKDDEYLYIQTHNFPDHDAVASAFGLQNIFSKLDKKSYLIYEGDITRDSLKKAIKELNINIKHASNYSLKEEDKIIVVDGCKGNKNVTDLIGDEIAVIDHHEVRSPDDVPYNDIRSGYGACSSIIYTYYNDLKLDIPREIATALMIGINMDTSLLTRGVSEMDISAYAELYRISDIRLQNTILRNYIQQKDLMFYKFAIDEVKINDDFAFCYFPEGCNQNLLGILGDFFLALKEVDFVVLCANNKNKINFSIRSERDEWNASIIIQSVLKEIGFGGGHADMAGGIINDTDLFNEDAIYNKLKEVLKNS